MWKRIKDLPKGETLLIIVQTDKDVYQCVWTGDKIHYPGRADFEKPEHPIRWTEDVGA